MVISDGIELAPATSNNNNSGNDSKSRPADTLILLNNSEIARIQTKEGKTVAELSAGGRQVLLIFWRSLLCPFCREQMQDLSTKLASLRKLQANVVMIYSATEKVAREFFDRYNFTGYEDCVHYINDPECTLYDAFGVGNGNFFQTWVPIAKHPTRGFISPAAYINTMKRSKQQGAIHGSKAEMAQYGEERLSAVFVFHNGAIINEMREFHNHDLPDFLDLVLDPKRAGGAQTTNDYSRFYTRLATSVDREALQKFLASADSDESYPSDTSSQLITESEDDDDDDDDDDDKRSGRRFFMCFPVKSSVQPRVPPEEATLNKVLESKKARAFFALFAARECSIENVRFWEEVQTFKKASATASASTMQKRANAMYTKFFTDESPLLLNITQELKDKVWERLNGGVVCNDETCKIPEKDAEVTVEIHPELFDQTLLEVMTVLSDTFMRFKQSDQFHQMLLHM